MKERTYYRREGKRLAAYLKKFPKSSVNAVFLADVMEEAGDYAKMPYYDLLDAAKNVIGERMIGKIDYAMKSKALDALEKVLYNIQTGKRR
jgi:hypothetical protein